MNAAQHYETEQAPAVFTAEGHFLDSLPRWTYAANAKDKLWRYDLARAIGMKYIAPDRKKEILWLKFDLDDPRKVDGRVGRSGSRKFEHTAVRWLDLGLPQPHAIVRSWDGYNLGSHYLYGLRVPVIKSINAAPGPLKLYGTVVTGLTRMLGADRGYSGLTIKNPINTGWHTTWADLPLYDLTDLLTELPREYRRSAGRGEQIAEGRHADLFLTLRKWAYQEVGSAYLAGSYDRWLAAVRQEAHGGNIYAPRLTLSEVEHVARQVAKWTWNRAPDFINRTGKGDRQWKRREVYSWNRTPLTPEEALERRREGQAQGALTRSNATADRIIQAIGQLIQAGTFNPSKAQIAQAAGVSVATVARYRASLNMNAGGN